MVRDPHAIADGLIMGDIEANLEGVRERIARAAERSGRTTDAITLIGVTKTIQANRIAEAVGAGLTHLGENRVQEAEAKFGGLADSAEGVLPREDITLHLIGSLQRNKARRTASLFDVVHSVDRLEIAADLDKWAHERTRRPLPVLLQVNLTEETSKSGVPRQDLSRLADALASCPNLLGIGLMTIARLGADEIELRQTFSTLRRLLEELRQSCPGEWTHLSMGMSDDYEYAIEEGSTMVRIGRAIFGERET